MKKYLTIAFISISLTGALLTGAYFAMKYHRNQKVEACALGVLSLAYEIKMPLPKHTVMGVCDRIIK